MFSTSSELLKPGVRRYQYFDEEGCLSFAKVTGLWAESGEVGNLFRQFHTDCLISSEYSAFRWETPAIGLGNQEREFEYVLVDSPGLSRRENGAAFNEFLLNADSSQNFLTFPNLGKNAILVVPTKSSQPEVRHCHLGEFLRSSPRDVADELWVHVAKAMQNRVSEKPVWLSTAGGGVPWLHVRLDDRPKYYNFAPYRAEPTDL